MKAKLLLVEDQSLFRKGLRKIIEEETAHWEVVGEAEDGESAIRQIIEKKPHLVLTDIQMPVMNGIKLSEYLHEHVPDVLVVIITGYKDFEYAQEAVRLGVFDYVLKPVNKESVQSLLTKAYDKLKQQDNLKRHALDHGLRSILLRLPSDERISQDTIRCIEDCRLWVIRILSYYPESKNYQSGDLGLLQFAVKNIVVEILYNHEAEGYFIPIIFDEFAFFVNADHEKADIITREIRESILTFLGIRMFLVPGGQVGRLHRLPEVYEAFQIEAGSKIIMQPADSGDSANLRLNEELLKKLKSDITLRMTLGDPGKLMEYADEFIDKMSGTPLYHAKMHAFTFTLALKEIAASDFQCREKSKMHNGMEQLLECEDKGSITGLVKQHFGEFMTQFKSWQSGKSDNLIHKALQYIEENYMLSCTLTETAGALHVNESYLSKTFKKSTGETFSNYLTKFRMEKAKLLIANTDMKMFEIATAIGYDDPNYFASVFRSTQNISPTAFRKQKE